ncbi:MAG: CDP-alcohol phosphatidyltransferase family protein [Coriobacteriaceae bacterium]|nr:CDP-alcohol phosphatidyltransferase family protein [Coriobacteriaceae bacterium]
MDSEEKQSNRILTLPNLFSLIRFLLIPLFLWLLFGPHLDIAALVVFAVAAGTDWVDGQVARRTQQISRIGKIIDPLIDRILIACGVIALFILGRLPLWMLIFLIARDVILLLEGRLFLSMDIELPSVVYVGKFATAFLLFGFAFLLFGLPLVPSLGIAGAPAWLVGFGLDGPVYFGIYLIYAGIVCSIIAFVLYHVRGIRNFIHRNDAPEAAAQQEAAG